MREREAPAHFFLVIIIGKLWCLLFPTRPPLWGTITATFEKQGVLAKTVDAQQNTNFTTSPMFLPLSFLLPLLSSPLGRPPACDNHSKMGILDRIKEIGEYYDWLVWCR